MIISGELSDSTTVTAGYDPLANALTYSVEAKPLPAAGTTPLAGGKRGFNLDGYGYRVDEASDDDDDDDEMRD